MTIENKALVLDLLEFVAKQPRSYVDVMDAWRTSCPRLPIWEDACASGFVTRESGSQSVTMVRLTAKGEAFLRSGRRANQ